MKQVHGLSGKIVLKIVFYYIIVNIGAWAQLASDYLLET